MVKIQSIHVFHEGFFYTNNVYKSNRFLRYIPLSLISSIIIIYRLNKKNLIIVTIDQDKVPNWQVSIANKPLFSFRCIDRKEFWKIYDKKLNKEFEKLGLLEKPKMIRTKPPLHKMTRNKPPKQ